MSLRTMGILAPLAVVALSASASHAQTQPLAGKERDPATTKEIQPQGKRDSARRAPLVRPGDRTRKAGDFADLIKAVVKERSVELCSRYGSDPDCTEKIEVCFSMLDQDNDLMKICLNTAPEGRGPNGSERTRLRR